MTADSDGLEAYFTDVEYLRDAFRQLVSAPMLPKRLLVIHGVGGAGKSSLLRMFRLHCKSVHVPLGLASGDEAKSAVDVLTAWADDLKADRVKLPTFAETFDHYQAIQVRVEERARKSSGVAGKFAVKTAEGVAGSVAGAAIGSVFPIIGPFAGAAVGALVGTSGEALTEWLGGFLNKPDVDLLLDPVKRLTDDFLMELARIAPKRRLVLLLDTFEQLSVLEDWARDLAQGLHANVLLVIGGRAVPNWSRQWMGWLAQADVQELKPMTEEVMRALIERYYATMRGGTTDPAQVTAIVGFARGLPVVVTSAVQLWVEYGVEDFQAVKPQVVADLVDRLLEGVPRTLVPVLEAAAAVRWFNKNVLHALLGQSDDTSISQFDAYSPYEAGLRDLLSRLDRRQPAYDEALIYQQRLTENIAQARHYGDDDTRQAERAEIVARLNMLASATIGSSFNALYARAVAPFTRSIPIIDIDAVYDELRRFPFTRPRAEGLALHDAVREIIDENLRVHAPGWHRELHQRAAAYFETVLVEATGQEAERLGLERLYHYMQADEAAGIGLFRAMAENLVNSRLINRLRAFMSDVNTYPLEHENSRLWRAHYNAWLAYLDRRYAEAERLFEAIGENERAEATLRAYALCELGRIWSRRERLGQPGGVERALHYLERSRALFPLDDSGIAFVFSHLRKVYDFKGEWQKSITLLEQQRQIFQQHGDDYGAVYILSLLKESYAGVGDWRKANSAIVEGLEILNRMPETAFLRSRLSGYQTWHLIWSGRYCEAEQAIRQTNASDQESGESSSVQLRDLGLVLGLQGKYAEATILFAELLLRYEGSEWVGGKGIALSFSGKMSTRQGMLDRAEQNLTQGLAIAQAFQDNTGVPPAVTFLAELYEVKAKQTEGETRTAALAAADSYHEECLQYRWTGRHYFECSALTGLVRVEHAQGGNVAIPPLLAEAEVLAQQYEYNDHLASLRLSQAQLAWDGALPEFGRGFDAALGYYKQALIYALRYNRFLLDEVLWGGGVSTPLKPIIPHCLERTFEGQRMLTALSDWWQAGANDLGTPRPDTISPIPEGISLLEAERIAREREPGDGTPQRTVLDAIADILGGNPSR